MCIRDRLNIYDNEPLEIQLSPLLSPTENAQAYYKRYNKYKRAQSEVQNQIETTREMLNYLASIDASLTTATTKNEIAEIKQELITAGPVSYTHLDVYKRQALITISMSL